MSKHRKALAFFWFIFGVASNPVHTGKAEAALPSLTYELLGATFDDGGTASGEFSKYVQLQAIPLPEFYNISVATSAGTALPGATFASSTVCYDNTKKFVCAPNSNLLISLDTGVPGQPGYDHFQIAAYFAPNALVGRIGALDPTFSYETGCTQSGCFTRHITSGAIRQATAGASG